MKEMFLTHRYISYVCSLNTRFGVVAVPTILLFHSGKPVLKFNNTVTLDDLRNFVKNSTGNVWFTVKTHFACQDLINI